MPQRLALSVLLLFLLGFGVAGPPAVRTIRVGNFPGAAIVADVNGDGAADLVVTNQADGTATVLLGDGHGGLTPAPGSPFRVGQQPSDIAVADFNSDRHLDLAVANHGAQFVTVLWGDGRGGFSAPLQIPVRSEPHPHGIVAGDFRGHGRADLAIDSFAHDQLEILENDGVGRFHSAATLGTGRHPYERLRAADLLHRGRLDLIVADYEGGDLTVLLNQGGGVWAPPRHFAVPPHPFAVAACDVNGDGHLDLVVSHYSGHLELRGDDAISVWLGDGRGSFRPAPGSPFHAGGAPVAIACADLDGDGFADVATANSGSDSVTILPGGREHMGQRRDIGVGRTPSFVAVGTLEVSEPPRLVVVDSADNDVRILSFH